MVYILKTLAKKYGLRSEKNEIDGSVGGYQVSISLNAGSYYLVFPCYGKDKQDGINAYLAQQRARGAEGILLPHGFCIRLLANKWGVAKTMERILNDTVASMSAAQIPGADVCPESGERMDNPVRVRFGSYYFFMQREAALAYAEQIRAEEEQKRLRENAAGEHSHHHALGVLGAVVGAAIGCVVWAIVYQLGFFMSIVSVLISFLAGLLYEKFGGENDSFKVVTVIVVTIVSVLITMLIVYVLTVKAMMLYEGIEGSAIEMLFYLLREDSDLLVDVLFELFLSLVFSLAGCIYTFHKYKQDLFLKKQSIVFEIVG